MTGVIFDLLRALLGALGAGVLPGWPWAEFSRRSDGLAERLAYAAAVSMASVPAIALALARAFGAGVTLPVALGAVAVVAGSGLLACQLRGRPGQAAGPVLTRPDGIRDGRVLALALLALGLALACMLGMPAPGWLLITLLAAFALVGLLAQGRRQAPRSAPLPEPRSALPPKPHSAPAHEPGKATGAAPNARSWRVRSWRVRSWRAPALAAVLALTALLSYAGVVRHDWPYLRGEDQFSHAVMTEQILAHGSYASYLVYPPGFSTLSAVICRFAGLTPLRLFPVLAPALLLLTTVGAYALATRCWGWDYGVAAAALSGLVLVGPYVSFGGGLYPDLLSAFFLMVMVVAALITLYQSPSARSGLLVAVVGASVVLYHSVVSLYLVLLLATVTLVCLPYLLWRRGRSERALARAVTLTLAALGALSLAYAWYIYDLGQFFSPGATARATIDLDVGSQGVLGAADLLTWVGSPIIWLGVLGFAALLVTLRRLAGPAQVLAALTMLAWCVTMYLGSRTTLDGFPQRFERDVGAPLTILAALGVGLITRSLGRLLASRSLAGHVAGPARPRAAGPARLRAAALMAGVTGMAVVVALVATQFAGNLAADGQPSQEVLTQPEAAAGNWLRQHNTGGAIISTPDLRRGITNRAVLAMGGYTGLQSYELAKVQHPRSLPTAGLGPVLDSRQVLLDPDSCRSLRIIIDDDVRFIFLYWPGTQANLAGFRADPADYHLVFENSQILIYAPRLMTARACG